MEHRIYRYNQVRGLSAVPSAKCLCGAEMVGEAQIAAHEALIPTKKISAENHG